MDGGVDEGATNATPPPCSFTRLFSARDWRLGHNLKLTLFSFLFKYTVYQLYAVDVYIKYVAGFLGAVLASVTSRKT